jgi:prophage DNA circulation protein
MDIRDIHNPWRDGMLPAQYKGARFHVDSGAVEGGRRIVEHEFPKRDTPYAEDLGGRAERFTVRAYCIAYPTFRSQLLQPDYRRPRDQLIRALEAGGSGQLQLPYGISMTVVCERYRMTEEEKYGGYCVFDITFNEAGSKSAGSANTGSRLQLASGAAAGATSASLG